MYLILMVLLVLLIAGWPRWGYHNLAYYPSGLAGVLIVILLILLLTGRL